MVTLTAESLRDAARCSLVTASAWVQPINETLYLFGIDSPGRAAAWLAQVSHESAQFTRLRESMTYSSAARLCTVWPARFPTLQSAQPYVGRPAELAEKVYGSRMGNDRPGDGLRFRGRGLLQVTGGDGYREARDGLRDVRLGLKDVPDFEVTPDALELPRWAALSAGLYWHKTRLNAYADRKDLVGITRAINGGATGLAERQAIYKVACRSLGA
jgi:putative chitinase